eukprot:6198124-Pleurochrysis_carterae.AAC.2
MGCLGRYGGGATSCGASAPCVLRKFGATYQKEKELTKQHTKQTMADGSHAEKKLGESRSLHTKHDTS